MNCPLHRRPLHRRPLHRRPLLLALAIALGGSAASQSFAAELRDRPDLPGLVNSADFVFRGVVEDVRYVLSKPSGKSRVRLPYTLVTFRVDSVMKGMTPNPTVTLRFLGGWDPNRQLFMDSSRTPLFDVGDEDILFATNEGNHVTSLVNNKDGRFRVIGGKVYSEEGREVALDTGGHVRLGKSHPFEAVLTHHAGGHVMLQKTTSHKPSAETDAASRALAADAFVRAIDDAVAQVGNDRSAPFLGTDPNAAFDGPDMAEAPPPRQ